MRTTTWAFAAPAASANPKTAVDQVLLIKQSFFLGPIHCRSEARSKLS